MGGNRTSAYRSSSSFSSFSSPFLLVYRSYIFFRSSGCDLIDSGGDDDGGDGGGGGAGGRRDIYD